VVDYNPTRLQCLDYQALAELAKWRDTHICRGLQFFDVGRGASDHEFVGDAAYIHLEIEALHRRAREMPG
jgi:hypothetical protein